MYNLIKYSDNDIKKQQNNLKSNFNPSKQAEEVLSLQNYKKCHNFSLNNSDVSQTNSQRHLGVVLDSKLIFHDHLAHLCKPDSILPRAALVTIFKTFVRLHLDYGDVLHD